MCDSCIPQILRDHTKNIQKSILFPENSPGVALVVALLGVWRAGKVGFLGAGSIPRFWDIPHMVFSYFIWDTIFSLLETID